MYLNFSSTHVLIGQFTNIQKRNKETYDSIDDFIHQLKEDIGEPISTRYIIDIPGTTTRDADNKKLFLPHHTPKNQYYVQWCFERGSIVKLF